MFSLFLLEKQNRDLCTMQVLLKDRRKKALEDWCHWMKVLGLNICPARALVTTSGITLEGNLCITPGLSKWKSLRQVGKGWEQLSRFWETNYVLLPFFTHGDKCLQGFPSVSTRVAERKQPREEHFWIPWTKRWGNLTACSVEVHWEGLSEVRAVLFCFVLFSNISVGVSKCVI